MEIKRINLIEEIESLEIPQSWREGDERDYVARVAGEMLRRKKVLDDFWTDWRDISEPFHGIERDGFYVISWTNRPTYRVPVAWTINSLLKAHKCVVFGGKDYKLKDGASKEAIYEFVMDHIDSLGEISDWDEARVGKELADYPVSAKIIKGRMIELCYHPVSSWCGDEWRGGDCYRSDVGANVECEKTVYLTGVDEEAHQRLKRMVIEKFYDELPVHEVKFNKEKIKALVAKKKEEWVREAIEEIKDENWAYKDIVGMLEGMSKGLITNKDLTYAIWREFNNFSPIVDNVLVREEAVKRVLTELKEQIAQVYSQVECFEISYPTRRGSKTLYLYLPKEGNEITCPECIIGLVIGKGGENIKKLSSFVGRRLRVKKD